MSIFLLNENLACQPSGLTPAPPDRLRRGDAAAIWQVSRLGEIVVSPSPVAGEPFRWAAENHDEE